MVFFSARWVYRPCVCMFSVLSLCVLIWGDMLVSTFLTNGKAIKFHPVLLFTSLSLPAFLRLCSLCCIIPRPLGLVIMITCCPPLWLLCTGHPLSLLLHICLKTHTYTHARMHTNIHTLSFCSLPQEFHAWLAKGGVGGCPDAFPQWLLDPGYFGIAY